MINIFGGSIGGVVALGSGTITIAGIGFNLPLGNITATSGTLTGVLLDGSALSVTFGRASTATIMLVPEPSTALLLATELLVLARKRRRSN